MEEEQKTITINDREYVISDLSQEALRCINQLIAINTQLDKLSFEADQLLGSKEHFTTLLMQALPDIEE